MRKYRYSERQSRKRVSLLLYLSAEKQRKQNKIKRQAAPTPRILLNAPV